MGWLDKLGLKKEEKLDKGVEKSREGLLNKIGKSIAGKDKIDDATLDDLEDALLRYATGRYQSMNRMVLCASVQREGETIWRHHAINDVFLTRAGRPKLASLSASYGSRFISNYLCDGLIVSSPSGSTVAWAS